VGRWGGGRRGRHLSRRSLTLAALLLLACGRGSYLFDLFPETHYQPSYRRQKPARRPSPPDAVPVFGREAPLRAEDAATLTNPLLAGPGTLERGAALYQTNCAMCYGRAGRGDGILVGYFRAAGVRPAVDLSAAETQQKTDGELFYRISYGVRDEQTLAGMPPFRALLTVEERRVLVHYIRSLPGALPG
jgi:mono/diheme cytochrome c family protein